MTKKYLKLSDMKAYKRAYHLSNYVWDIVSHWPILAQKTVGEQFIRSTDSISSNLAEGFGRQTRKDKTKFYIYARASANESLDWNQKAKRRNLLTKEQYDFILIELQQLPKEINAHIKLTYTKLSK
ncbi:four helix bundle protein [Patescibacteria group bacterium]|nr:four helix bundle protein [Patescibacteria group bacterium]MBU2260173.1 four helix bundle protein [Patescibacteria group bacterium]